jgi:hypothetical protein
MHTIAAVTPPVARILAIDRRYQGVTMADPAVLAELDKRIRAVRENIRTLTEQAAALSGAEDEERSADRIAEQDALLQKLLKDRANAAK